MNLLTVYNIAKETRNRAVRRAVHLGFKPELDGFCARASCLLWKALTKRGIDVKIAYANIGYASHVFLLWNDFIIDITASQFNEKNVIIFKNKIFNKRWYWRISDILDNPQQLIAKQKHFGWPDDQIARIDE